MDQTTFLRALEQERQNRRRDSQQTAQALGQGKQILIRGLGFERRAEDTLKTIGALDSIAMLATH